MTKPGLGSGGKNTKIDCYNNLLTYDYLTTGAVDFLSSGNPGNILASLLIIILHNAYDKI
jgi:hypothetical protein